MEITDALACQGQWVLDKGQHPILYVSDNGENICMVWSQDLRTVDLPFFELKGTAQGLPEPLSKKHLDEVTQTFRNTLERYVLSMWDAAQDEGLPCNRVIVAPSRPITVTYDAAEKTHHVHWRIGLAMTAKEDNAEIEVPPEAEKYPRNALADPFLRQTIIDICNAMSLGGTNPP